MQFKNCEPLAISLLRLRRQTA